MGLSSQGLCPQGAGLCVWVGDNPRPGETFGSLMVAQTQEVGLHSVSLEAHVPKTNQHPSVVSLVKDDDYFLKVLDITRSINQITA